MRKKIVKKINKLIYFKRINHSLLFLLIIFLPSQLGKHFFFSFSYLSGVRVDYLAPTLYLTDLIVFLLFLLNFKHFVLLIKKKKIFLILFLLSLNIFFSYSPFLAFYRLLKIIELLIIFIIFYQTKTEEKTVVFGFLIGGLIELILSLLQFINQRSLQGIFYFLGERYFTLGTPGIAKASIWAKEFLRPYGTFSHPNSLAGFYLLLYFFLLTNKKLDRYFFLKSLSLFVFTVLVLISFSKIAIITFLFLNLIYLFSAKKIRCLPCFLSQLVVLLTTSLIFLQSTTNPLSWQRRLELLKKALVIILKHPIFGVGLGNFLLAQQLFSQNDPLFLNQPVHNIFLLLITEIGLPLSVFIIFKLLTVFTKKKQFIYPLAVVFITGMFDHYWLTLQQNFLLLGIVGGIILKTL